MLTFTTLTLAASSFLLAGSTRALAGDEKAQGDSERMTMEAWNAFNNADYQSAIRKAEVCIKEFRRTADTLQKSLKDKNEPTPAVGEVSDEAQRRALFNRGPLNDVATCYFITGEAYSRIAAGLDGSARKEQLQKAKAAYEATAKYTYARVWDERGWFWDPSAKANERLEDMEPVGS